MRTPTASTEPESLECETRGIGVEAYVYLDRW